MSSQQHHDFSQRLVRQVAADTDSTPPTVTKVLIGAPVRGRVRERIVDALRARGIEIPALQTADELEAAQQQQPARAAGGGR